MLQNNIAKITSSLFLYFRIKINKESKGSWPAALPAWPAPPSSHHQQSWSSAIPETISYETFLQSQAPNAGWAGAQPQSSPPTKITHSYLPPEYVADHSGRNSLKQGEQYLTTYFVKDGSGLSDSIGNSYAPNRYNNRYNLGALSINSNPPSYGRNQDLELRKPIVVSNKPVASAKKTFGQPSAPLASPIDDYESGKGTATIYNNEVSNESPQRPENTRVQFQNSNDNNNDYKPQNELNYDDRIRSVSSDYSGSQINNDANNYDENNELINEQGNKDQTYVADAVPAVRIPLRKKAKV